MRLWTITEAYDSKMFVGYYYRLCVSDYSGYSPDEFLNSVIGKSPNGRGHEYNIMFNRSFQPFFGFTHAQIGGIEKIGNLILAKAVEIADDLVEGHITFVFSKTEPEPEITDFILMCNEIKSAVNDYDELFRNAALVLSGIE